MTDKRRPARPLTLRLGAPPEEWRLPPRRLTRGNIGKALATYRRHVEELSLGPAAGLRGLDLLLALKRKKVGGWPYGKDLTWSETANRIMSDLVILYGVRFLLRDHIFPFREYTVQYGIENEQGYDVRAGRGRLTLKGEAFNVAESFFQNKKSSSLAKLRKPPKATCRLIMFNQDAVKPGYAPRPEKGEYFVLVNVQSGDGRIVPGPQPGI